MTSLEERRAIFEEIGSNLHLFASNFSGNKDILPVLVAMTKFMKTMLEEDEANALLKLLKRNGMAR